MSDSLQHAKALVIDANANARSLITAQLRELGIGFVRSVNRVKDARIVLENAPFDLVICDYHFEGHEESGQDLLDELRREQLLPQSTVFIMVTADASYSAVAGAAEARRRPGMASCSFRWKWRRRRSAPMRKSPFERGRRSCSSHCARASGSRS